MPCCASHCCGFVIPQAFCNPAAFDSPPVRSPENVPFSAPFSIRAQPSAEDKSQKGSPISILPTPCPTVANAPPLSVDEMI